MLKFIWKHKRLQIAKENLNTKSKARALIILVFTTCGCNQNRLVQSQIKPEDQWSRVDTPEETLTATAHNYLKSDPQQIQGEKSLSKK